MTCEIVLSMLCECMQCARVATGLDSAAVGRLTAYCAETQIFLQVDPAGNVVEDV